jgi:transposase
VRNAADSDPNQSCIRNREVDSGGKAGRCDMTIMQLERTLAWLNRCRRLAKDFENLSRNALAFLQLASIRLMLRKLCNPS